MEMSLRKALSQKLVRGKISLYSRITVSGGGNQPANFNTANVRHYLEQLEKLEAETGLKKELFYNNLLRMPETMFNVEEVQAEEWQKVEALILEAADDFTDFRKTEGGAIEKDLDSNIGIIQSKLKSVEHLLEERIEIVRSRILKSIKDLSLEHDRDRFEQEIIYYLEKLDVNEEMKRLEQHLKYFAESLSSEKSAGKRLGFIAQEMGREINTLGSKANHAAMQRLVVEMKEALEKIKEQVLNAL